MQSLENLIKQQAMVSFTYIPTPPVFRVPSLQTMSFSAGRVNLASVDLGNEDLVVDSARLESAP